tara:strand:+ start:6096 stop:6797 length:702 start_codon:yes stop_codon:yes gene_type:complete
MKYNLIENQSPELEDIYLKTFGYREAGFFVELGVGHTYYPAWARPEMAGQPCGSNTASLADLGWQGIYVEPHPFYFEECKRRHLSNTVKIVNYAAGSENRKVTLGLGDTLRSEVQDNFNRLGFLSEAQRREDYPDHTFEVLEKNVNDILADCDCPNEFDLLSIDVEGYEKIIIDAFNFNEYRPKLVVVEVRTGDTRFDKLLRDESEHVEETIISAGYSFEYTDQLNAVFLRSD